MKILIIGAGIGGLAAAAHLRKLGHELTIVEKFKERTDDTYVLGVWSGLAHLDDYNFTQLLATAGKAEGTLAVRDKKGEVIRIFDLAELNNKYGQVFILSHAKLHELLLTLIPNTSIRYDVSVIGLDERQDEVAVAFSDGTSTEYDLVIGSDGVHSHVRDLAKMEYVTKYFGLEFWMYRAPASVVQPAQTTMIADKGRFFGAYPSGEQELCTIFALKTTSERVKAGENDVALLKSHYADFGWIVPQVLSTITSKSILYFDNTYEVTLPQWHTRRVVLIGDSAHAVVATASSGASMALEDAYVLADELQKVDRQGIPVALVNYQIRKWKRVEKIRRASHFYGYLIRTSSPTVMPLRDAFLRIVPESVFLSDLISVLSTKPY